MAVLVTPLLLAPGRPPLLGDQIGHIDAGRLHEVVNPSDGTQDSPLSVDPIAFHDHQLLPGLSIVKRHIRCEFCRPSTVRPRQEAQRAVARLKFQDAPSDEEFPDGAMARADNPVKGAGVALVKVRDHCAREFLLNPGGKGVPDAILEVSNDQRPVLLILDAGILFHYGHRRSPRRGHNNHGKPELEPQYAFHRTALSEVRVGAA